MSFFNDPFGLGTTASNITEDLSNTVMVLAVVAVLFFMVWKK